MVNTYLIDTNIWGAHEMGYPDAVSFIEQLIKTEATLLMSQIIELELLSFYLVETDPETRANRELYIQVLADEVLPVDSKAIRVAADMRRKRKIAKAGSLKGPDAMIAATAILYNAILVSNNDKDFLWVKENYTYKGQALQYFNPIVDNKEYQQFNDAYKSKKGI